MTKTLIDEQGEYKICKQCGRKFYRKDIFIKAWYLRNPKPISSSKWKLRVFCSRECRGLYDRREFLETKRKWFFCKYCGERITKDDYTKKYTEELGYSYRQALIMWSNKFESKNNFCSNSCSARHSNNFSNHKLPGNRKQHYKNIVISQLEKYYQAPVEKRKNGYWVNCMTDGSLGWRPVSKTVYKKLFHRSKAWREKIGRANKGKKGKVNSGSFTTLASLA